MSSDLRTAPPGEDVKAEVKRLWLAGGKSFTAIAGGLGLTTGQVAGIVNRAGLNNSSDRKLAKPRRSPKRSNTIAVAPTQSTKRKTAEKKSKPFTEPVEPDDEVPEPMPEHAVTLADLSTSVCHWPIGDPQQKDFRFCGRKAGHITRRGRKSPYCDAHEWMATDRRTRQERVDDAIRAKGEDARPAFP